MLHSNKVKKINCSRLLWLLIYFEYFSSLLQIYIVITGRSNYIGLRDSLLYSVLWLVPTLFFPRRTKLVAGIIGIILWFSSVIALAYFVVYGQQISQSVMFIIFETNTNEANEFLKQYLSCKVIVVVLLYTLVGMFLWTFIKPVTLPISKRLMISLLIFILLFGIPYYKKSIQQNKSLIDIISYLNSKLAYSAPWQFISSYFLYKHQLAHIETLIYDNNKILPLKNLIDTNGNKTRTFVLVIGESTSRDRMSLYGYKRPTTPKLQKIKRNYPNNFAVFNNVITSRPYTIEALQQILTFSSKDNPDIFDSHFSIMNMMKQAGFKTFWITNQQTITERNTLLTAFSQQTDKIYYLNNNMAQSSRIYDDVVFAPFKEALSDPAEKKFIVIHLLGTHMRYEFRYPKNKAIFKVKDSQVPSNLNNNQVKDYNAYDNAQHYNDYIISILINSFHLSKENGFLVFFSDHGENVFDSPPHETLGRSEDNPTRVMYNIPFFVWQSPSWLNSHHFNLNNKINRPYSMIDFIYSWSDLAGLHYNGYIPEKSLFSDEFQPQPRYIGDPEKKLSLILYDDLMY
ncbi:Phosphoethanolamine transferase EptC [Candidatus Hartigia pinicola]|nr:Phosphoethanolamine transferase EptC [Candidatus Hartigia pinicola]